ncbi:MAG: hypothetical protein ACW968_04325 [Candidatus Thorarchaeota archaeon]|jgi:DNA-binding transcriptional ArsR family regulator
MSPKEIDSKSSSSHEDFISSAPELVQLISASQMSLMDEYSSIMRALVEGPKTVKEIHSLYWNHREKKHTKTIKTVYRHLDVLEEGGLVKVAGHRKPSDSRMTEKLYSRSAMVFFLEEKDRGSSWWETDSGKEQLERLGNLIFSFFGVSDSKSSEFQELMIQYYGSWDQTVRKLFEETSQNKALANVFGKAEIYNIKSMANMVGMLGAFRDKPGLLDRMMTLLQEK